MYLIEDWLPVPSKPGVWASTHGRIRRDPHISQMPNGGTRIYMSEPTFGVITKATAGARHLYFGYVYRGIGNIKVHAAVCEAFHGEIPEWATGVRHLNENGLDNRPINLEWSDQRVNLNDPELKVYHSARAGIHLAAIPKTEKRFEIYASILDVAEAAARRLQ